MFRKLILFIPLFLLLNSDAQSKPPIELELKSKTFIQKLPADFQYGWIKVPEDYNKPDGKQIYVFYYGPKSKSAKSVPVIIYNGGPGGSSHNYFMGLRNAVKDLNFIFIDQRGTGASSPLPEAKKENINRYLLYLSENIVRDSERIREKFYKGKKWTVVGHSYGSLIVHRYITMFPNSLHSAHAHGYSLISNPKQYPELRLLAHKNTLDSYFKAYPKDRKLLKQLTSSMSKEDFIQDGDLIIRGRAIIDYMGLFILGTKNTWPHFHNFLNNVFIVDGKVDKAAVKRFVKMVLFQSGGFSLKMSLLNIVFNRQEGYLTGEESLHSFYEKLFEKLKKDGIDPYEWEVGEEAFAHLGLDSEVLKTADEMKLNKYPLLIIKDVVAGLQKNKDLKFYLYSGSFDSFSPPKMFKEMADSSEQVIYKNFEKSGHEGFMVEPEFWNKVKELTKAKELIKE